MIICAHLKFIAFKFKILFIDTLIIQRKILSKERITPNLFHLNLKTFEKLEVTKITIKNIKDWTTIYFKYKRLKLHFSQQFIKRIIQVEFGYGFEVFGWFVNIY